MLHPIASNYSNCIASPCTLHAILLLSVFPFINCRICVYIYVPTYLSTYTFCWKRASCWKPACSSIGIRCLSPLQVATWMPIAIRCCRRSTASLASPSGVFGRKSSSIWEGNPHASSTMGFPTTWGIYNGPPSGKKTNSSLTIPCIEWMESAYWKKNKKRRKKCCK